jgi:predicted dienelactone hydrolase
MTAFSPRTWVAFAAAALAWSAAGGCAAAVPPTAAAVTAAAVSAPAAATYEVTIVKGEWVDAKRGRTIPYKLYLPSGPGPFPVVVHSHGLGGSREGSTFINEALAREGIAVFAIQHPGSDSGILDPETVGAARQGRLQLPPGAAEGRFGDLPFALDQITALNADGPYKGRFNLQRIGMAGHSFGALSTLIAVGQSLPLVDQRFRDPRIRAAIVYSPNKPRQGEAKAVFAKVNTPILHFTGTKDVSPLDLEETPWERTIPFQTITGADQFLIVLHDGDHGVFGGRIGRGGLNKPTDPAHVAVINAESIRFWRAWLLDDPAASAQLCDIPSRVAAEADGYVKASRCGAPTPLPR